MEITERLPLKPIHWLLQLSYSEFVEQCLNKDKKYTKEVLTPQVLIAIIVRFMFGFVFHPDNKCA